jgi:hypothetical protein
MGATISTERVLAVDILDPTTQADITAVVTVADITAAVVMAAVVVMAVAEVTTNRHLPKARMQEDTKMIRISARVLNVDRLGGQYLVTIQVPREKYNATFDRLTFGANKPHLGSYRSGWLDLAYEKNPGLKPGQSFPLWVTE